MSKAAPPAETPQPVPVPAPAGRDVRASRVYVLSRGPILGLVRRALSVLALVALDVAGLALGIYLALVTRELVRGEGDILWGLLWSEGPAEWLKFAAPITVLVFAQSGLYRQRELRPGAGRILSSLIVVALIVLAFGIGTGYDFTTSGLIPTAVLVSALTIGLLRASYASVSLELMRALGVRRRVVLVGEGASLAELRNSLAAARGGLAYEFVGVVAQDGIPGLRLLGSRDELASVLEDVRPDEVILSEAHFDEGTVLKIVEQAHRQGIKVRLAPDTTELLVQRGEYMPGHGAPLFELRPPVLTGWDWAVKRTFDIAVSAAHRRAPPAALAADRARDQARLARPGSLRRPAGRRRRARVLDAQVPDHGRRSGRPCNPGSRTRTKPRVRSSRSATIRASPAWGVSSAASPSTRSRRSSTSSKAR